MNWSNCDLIEVIPGKVSGVPLFKGTRLPADTILDNVDAYMDEGLTLDQAIEATLGSFTSVPNGAQGIRTLLAHRAASKQPPVFTPTSSQP